MKKLIGKKNLIMSAIALLLIAVMVAGVSYSWTESGNKGNVQGNDIVISAGSSLTMRQDGKVTNSIIIPAGTLEETSSADGRNFFFPLVSNKKNTTSENPTSDMVFREGIPADENKRYVSVDFELQAGDKKTPVYLGAGTIIQCKNTAVLNALRMSFNLNNGTDPIVFKPNQMPGITEAVTYSPITAITGAGAATTGTTETKAYGDFYYKGKNSLPLFDLKPNETLNITLTLWLEGTEFSGNDIKDSELSVFIDFTTTVDDLIKYNFVDNTHGYNSVSEYWVSNKMEWAADDDTTRKEAYDTMMYVYDLDTDRYYALEKVVDGGNKSTSTWSAYVPDTIRNFTFRRYSIDIDMWWNEWDPDMQDIKTDPNGEHTFVAICGNPDRNDGTEISGAYGYWKDEFGTFRIYFEMQVPFSNLHCYVWDKNGDPCPSTGAWPGKGMTFVKNTDNGVLYYIDLKETENVAGIQFNNGGDTTVYLDGFGYSTTTSGYMYSKDSNGKETLHTGTWPGQLAAHDTSDPYGAYTVRFNDTNSDNHGERFYVIANNGGNGAQYPTSGEGAEGKTGRVYRFKNGNMTLEKLAGPYNIPDEDLSKMLFNGAAFWFKYDDKEEDGIKSGYFVYTGTEKSLITPR